ncbi:hypothetical protein AB4Z54_30410, partial [Streptomyces sp. MCAF7]
MITLTPRTFAVHRLVQAVARTPDPADPHRGADAIDGARRRATGWHHLARPVTLDTLTPDAAQQRTIARIWQLTLDAIAARDPLAVEILRTAAWFGPDDVPRELAEALDDDPIAVDEALALLHAYSMITLTPRTFAVHRLVQAVARTPDPADPHRGADAIDGARRRA